MLAGYTGKYGRFEIERKFVLKEFPMNFSEEFHELQDIYLPDSSLRLRIARSSCGEILSRNLTQKTRSLDGDGSVSVMTSLYLSERDLVALGPFKGAIIKKRRYFVETETNRVTIDVFQVPLERLILAEVEFRSEAERDAYVPPESWTEVTGDPAYACGFLAFHPDRLPIL